MGKFSRDLDPELESKVKSLAVEMGLKATGINVEAVRLKKSKKDIGLVLKSNDLVELFTGDNSTVCVALYEDAFRRVDAQTQEIWIRFLLNQISYDMDKDKIVITKPELCVPLGMYRKFGNVVTQKMELALMAIAQIQEEEREAKELKKSKKKEQ